MKNATMTRLIPMDAAVLSYLIEVGGSAPYSAIPAKLFSGTIPEGHPDLVTQGLVENHGDDVRITAAGRAAVSNAPNEAPYSIGAAQYAGRWNGKPQKAVRCPSSTGYKTRAARLVEALKGRYSHRERAYIVSPAKAAKFEKLYADGWDASAVTGELEPPHGNSRA